LVDVSPFTIGTLL